MDVGTYLERVQKVRNTVNDIAVETLRDFAPVFSLLNVEQLKHGLKSTGEKIGKYKNEEYAKFKYSLNTLAGYGYIDLILTGMFTENFFVEVSSDEMLFDSRDLKKFELEQFPWWDDKIFGLTDENIEKEIDNIQKVFVENIIKVIG